MPVFLLFILGLVVLDVLAARVGVDSRDFDLNARDPRPSI